tara:strand:- start:402 stop:533 length:132 start_codon:yes stop_codon:yes gene_type:complete
MLKAYNYGILADLLGKNSIVNYFEVTGFVKKNKVNYSDINGPI